MSMSEAERLIICAEMFETAKAFASKRLPAGLSEDQAAKFIFNELYGFEMPE